MVSWPKVKNFRTGQQSITPSGCTGPRPWRRLEILEHAWSQWAAESAGREEAGGDASCRDVFTWVHVPSLGCPDLCHFLRKGDWWQVGCGLPGGMEWEVMWKCRGGLCETQLACGWSADADRKWLRSIKGKGVRWGKLFSLRWCRMGIAGAFTNHFQCVENRPVSTWFQLLKVLGQRKLHFLTRSSRGAWNSA